MPLTDVLWQVLQGVSPVMVVRTRTAGVSYVMGRAAERALPAGLYWRLPFVREIVTVPLAVQWADLPVQGVVTADDRAVALSANVAYRVTDPVRWHVQTVDAEHAVLNAIRPEVAAVVAGYDYDTLRTRIAAVNRLMRARARPAVRRLGAELVDVGLSDFVPARHYRLLQDTVIQ